MTEKRLREIIEGNKKEVKEINLMLVEDDKTEKLRQANARLQFMAAQQLNAPTDYFTLRARGAGKRVYH